MNITDRTRYPWEPPFPPAPRTTLVIDITDAHKIRQARARFDKAYFETMLRAHNWNVYKLTTVLKLSQAQIHKRIRDLGIEMPSMRERRKTCAKPSSV